MIYRVGTNFKGICVLWNKNSLDQLTDFSPYKDIAHYYVVYSL